MKKVKAAALREEIDRLRKVAEENYSKAQYIQETAEDPDDVMLSISIHYDAYLGEDKQQYYKTQELNVMVQKLATQIAYLLRLRGVCFNMRNRGCQQLMEKQETGRMAGLLAVRA